jgi:hypothetical protein
MWLDDLNQALDKAVKPVRFFFRDDDAGWANKLLFELLDCFSKFKVPIDLAVIPQAINYKNKELYNRVRHDNGLIGVHQHGFRHNNHQLDGRKCEFGSDRTYTQQHLDIITGQKILLDYFDELSEPIFTPPWNRCNQDTVNVLIDLGFSTLSRDNTGKPLDCQTLRQLPVNIDWFKKRHGIRISQTELGQLIEQVVTSGEVVGVMLHHEIMDQQERYIISELLELLSSHPRVRCEHMKKILSVVTVKDYVAN